MGGMLGGGGAQPNMGRLGPERGIVYNPRFQGSQDVNFQGLLNYLQNLGMGTGMNFADPSQNFARMGMAAGDLTGKLAPGLLQTGMNESRMISGLAPEFAALVPQFLQQMPQFQRQIGQFGAEIPQFLGQANAWLNPAQTSPIYQDMANRARQSAVAANAASGVQGPYAAGNVNDALRNLQLGWAAQAPQVAEGLLSGARTAQGGAITGLEGMAGAADAAKSAGAGALGFARGGEQLAQQSIQDYLSSGAAGVPQQQAISNMISNISGLENLSMPLLGEILNYLRLGQGAAGDIISANQVQGQLGQLGFHQQQNQLGQLGGLFSSLLGAGPLGSLLWGSGGGAFGSGEGLFNLLGGLGGGGGGAGPEDFWQ